MTTESPDPELLKATYGIQHRMTAEDFNEKYGWESEKPVERSNSSAVQIKNVGGVFVAHSNPAWYTATGKNFQIIDLVVEGSFGETEVDVRKRYDVQVEAAKEYRAFAREFVEKSVVPVIASINGINCIYGRGDIYDSERVPVVSLTERDKENQVQISDIDLIIFTETQSPETYETLKTQLAKTFPSVVFACHNYEVSAKGYSGDLEVVSSHTQKDPTVVSIDVFPMDQLVELATKTPPDKLHKIYSPYAVRSFTGGGEILWPDSAKDVVMPLDENGKVDISKVPGIQVIKAYALKSLELV